MEKIYYGKIYKSGTSLVLAIPVDISRGLLLGRGDIVAFAVAGDDVVCFRRVSDSEKREMKPDTIKI